MTILNDFLNLFFPRLCIVCDQRLIHAEEYICLSCLHKLPKTNYCNINNNKLEEQMFGRFPFERIASFSYFTKGGILQPLIHELKYGNKPLLGHFLGKISGEQLLCSSFLNSVDYLIPVPLHPKREKYRGYNQSLKIAEGISTCCNIPIRSDNLIRIIDNPSQTLQSQQGRWLNTECIFHLVSPLEIEGKHILLIDDILTTGSTIEACVKELINRTNQLKISVFAVGSVN